MDPGIPFVVLTVSVLLLAISCVTPLAARLRLPPSVLLVLIGIAIGGIAVLEPDSGWAGGFTGAAQAIVELPASSDLFLYVFLPMLLFNSALATDPRAMTADAVPVFVLAVVAVVVATLVIGVALWPLSGLPLAACLLLASIVATTDPSAVLSLFRDLGAPQRLIRLVEGESLLNDAAAIALFSLFVEAIVSGGGVDPGQAVLLFFAAASGGVLLGLISGWLFAWILGASGENRLVQMSVSLAVPYLVYVVGEALQVSGVVAVVTAGLTLAAQGPARLRPEIWRYVRQTWSQLGFWAESLVFVLAAILVPRLMVELDAWDLLLLLVVVLGALGARALILWGLLPFLSFLRVSPAVSGPFRAVLLWGGLRGAATLALALAVTEHAGLPRAVQDFVATLATGFVLFTLFVQGPTLRPLMRLFRLDVLSPVEAALRQQTLDVARHETDSVVRETARRLAFSETSAHAIAERCTPSGGEREPSPATALARGEQVALGLAMLASKERQIALQLFEEQVISPRIVDRLLSDARALLDGARAAGAEGYSAAAADALSFSRGLRAALWLHQTAGVSRFLAHKLARRFETLLAERMVMETLTAFIRSEILPILGRTVSEDLEARLTARNDAIERELEALRLQYPSYSDGLERQFLLRSALRHQAERYQSFHEDGVIGPEVLRALKRELAQTRETEVAEPALDLGLDTLSLIRALPLFSHLDDPQLGAIARLMKPRLALPGELLVRKGEVGDCAFFISSGAVEVDTGYVTIRLGRGDFFGELALLKGIRRQANVVSIAYCQLLVLFARDFVDLLERDETLRQHVENVAQQRIDMNRPDGPGGKAAPAEAARER